MEKEQEEILTKEYLVNWKNSIPDVDGLIRVKTVFRCDVKLVDSFLLTLPTGDKDFICVTDENERKSKEERIAYLKKELERLESGIPEEPQTELDGGAPCDNECVPCGDYNRDYYQTDYYTSTTYYNRDGKETNTFYDKEEIKRFTVRSLMLTGLIDDYKEKGAS